MKKVTIRHRESEHNLYLDFNRQVNEVISKVGINLTPHYEVVALVNNQIVNPNKTFNENQVENNEVLLIKGKYEIQL